VLIADDILISLSMAISPNGLLFNNTVSLCNAAKFYDDNKSITSPFRSILLIFINIALVKNCDIIRNALWGLLTVNMALLPNNDNCRL
jgi:hypothetical protein